MINILIGIIGKLQRSVVSTLGIFNVYLCLKTKEWELEKETKVNSEIY